MWKEILIVLNWLSLLVLAYPMVLFFYRKRKIIYGIVTAVLIVLNVILGSVAMLQKELFANLFFCTCMVCLIVFSFAAGGWFGYTETMKRKEVSRYSIKEGFDNLSCAISFFDAEGFLVLCNRQMHRLFYAFAGHDLQYINEIEAFFAKANETGTGILLTEEGRAWKTSQSTLKNEDGEIYHQYVAVEVTELYKNRLRLNEENTKLKELTRQLQTLSENVVALTREEEILSMKMRVHDEMGRSIISAQRYLAEEESGPIESAVITSWQRAVRMLKYNSEIQRKENMLGQLQEICTAMGLEIIQKGVFPKEEKKAYLLLSAIRECSTNAVRYGDATELYVDLKQEEREYILTIENNGKVPEKTITEGGGLTNLRRRVERIGGSMEVKSFPRFSLTVTLPVGGEQL